MVAGGLIGFIGGVVGLILGALRMPALLGARFTGRLSTEQLLRAIGAVLVVAAVGILVQIPTT